MHGRLLRVLSAKGAKPCALGEAASRIAQLHRLLNTNMDEVLLKMVAMVAARMNAAAGQFDCYERVFLKIF